MTSLLTDVGQQSRMIMNNITVDIRLWPAKNEFVLMTKSTNTQLYKLVIDEIAYNVCKVYITPEFLLAQNLELDKTLAKYPFTRTRINTYAIPNGNYSFTQDNLFNEELPDRVCIFLVRATAFQGDIHANPFNMIHADTNGVTLSVDDNPIGGKRLNCNFGTNSYIECYHHMMSQLNLIGHDRSIGLSYHDYGRGYTMFAFDMSNRMSPSHMPLLKRGNLKLNLTFASAVTEPVTVFVYAQFKDIYQIDRARNILI